MPSSGTSDFLEAEAIAIDLLHYALGIIHLVGLALALMGAGWLIGVLFTRLHARDRANH